MSLESLVRPFQTGDLAPPRQFYPSARQPALVRMTPGLHGGSVKSATGHYHITVTFYRGKTPTEVRTSGFNVG